MAAFLLALFATLYRDRLTSLFASEDAVLSYVALGDSITKGEYGDGSPSFAERYADYASADLDASVRLTNLGVNGLTSAGLLHLVRTDPSFRQAIANADLITLLIGYNDYFHARKSLYNGSCHDDGQDCLNASLTTYQSNLHEIIAEIQRLNTPEDTVLRLGDFYNSLMKFDRDPAKRVVLVATMDEASRIVHAEGSAAGVSVANVYDAFNGPDGVEDPISEGHMIDDSLHPTGTGYELIATAFRERGYTPLP